MTKPTQEFLNHAEKEIQKTLRKLRPRLLSAFGTVEFKLKDDKSVVTELDLMVEAELRDALSNFDSSIGFTGEESGGDYDDKTFWLVDPIDGTEAFTRGLPFSTNMIALIHEGRPVMSVIYNFLADDYFYAIKERGAYKNDKNISVSNRKIKRAVIAANINAQNDEHYSRLYDRLGQECILMPVRLIASGYEYTLVAQGSIEARISFEADEKPHDFAPGMLLVEEAGGIISNIGSEDYDFLNTNAIAASPSVYSDLMKIFEDYL